MTLEMPERRRADIWKSSIPDSLWTLETAVFVQSTVIGDEELLMMLLSLVMSLRDSRKSAKNLILDFGGLSAVLATGQEELCSAGLPGKAIEVVSLVTAAARGLTRGERTERVRIGDWMALDHYLSAPASMSEPPGFRALLLDNCNQLLGEYRLPASADPDDVATPIAGLLREALDRHATAVIVLRHSGQAPPTINAADHAFRTRAEAAAAAFSLTVHDLIIAGQGRWVSMRKGPGARWAETGVTARWNTVCIPWKGIAEAQAAYSAALADLAALAGSVRAAASPPLVIATSAAPRPNLGSDIQLVARLLGFVPSQELTATAAAMVRRFGSFAAVLAAPEAELRRMPGLRPRGVIAIKLVHAAAIRLARAGVMGRPLLDHPEHLSDYLAAVLSRERVEQLRILFLDPHGMLRADEIHAVGTVNHASVYPREVVRRALELGATAFVLAHNHPSGDPAPSEDDIAMTRKIGQAAAALSITIQDHIIVGNGRSFSFREAGLLGREEDRPGLQSHPLWASESAGNHDPEVHGWRWHRSRRRWSFGPLRAAG